MRKERTYLRAADLFCGAGGSSSGVRAACLDLKLTLELTAVNHWPVAVETHEANHSSATHYCEDLGAIDPLKAVPDGHLHLLVASPECTHHSNARGSKPMSDQSRASAWHITRWAGVLQIDNILIENIPEFQHWGPLGKNDRPIVSRRGETFRAFLRVLRSMNYAVDWRVLNAADYGDATTRKRLFIMAKKGNKKIVWPNPSHAPRDQAVMLGLQPWRPARDIIDWNHKGRSIFKRKKPLCHNTMKRIIAGLRKFGGPGLEPFIVMLNGTTEEHFNRCHRSASDPLPTVTGSNHLYLAEPFLIGQQSCAAPRSVSEPAPTIAGAGAVALVQPSFVLAPEGIHRGNAPRSTDDPLPTITAERGGGHLVEPFIVPQFASQGPRDINRPLGTITTQSRGVGLVQPIIVQTDQTGSQGPCARSTEEPLCTAVSKQNSALVEGFIVPVTHAGGPERCSDINNPVPTITGAHRGEQALVEPHIVMFYGQSTASSVSEPLDTVTSRDRFALVQPCIEFSDGNTYALDILFRMLEPGELAGAMSFPMNYQFSGNREAKVKQIGNAVPVRLSQALVTSLIQ